jgi:hypothetical protein
MSSLSQPSSTDDLPLLELLDRPLHEMTDEEKRIYVEQIRSARVNTNVLANKIQREFLIKTNGQTVAKTSSPGSKPTKPKPTLDITDLL